MLNSQSLPRIVPWSSWQEWEDVYRWLYSPNYADRALGVKRVRPFSAPRLPFFLNFDLIIGLYHVFVTKIPQRKFLKFFGPSDTDLWCCFRHLDDCILCIHTRPNCFFWPKYLLFRLFFYRFDLPACLEFAK
jgi:hypothetical protein